MQRKEKDNRPLRRLVVYSLRHGARVFLFTAFYWKGLFGPYFFYNLKNTYRILWLSQ